MNFILVFIGGGFGSILRYGISYFFQEKTLEFPIATFIANLIGSLIIGILLGISLTHTSMSQSMKLLLITGFCGGFTTFSTFSSESLFLLQNNMISTALLYIISSIILGILFVFIGIYLGKMI